MIRDARFADIPQIMLLLEHGYARTHYAKSGLAEIDAPAAKKLLVNAIQRHGGENGGSTWVQVAENEGNIEGLILGTLDRVYSIGNRLRVTDLFWTTTGRANPADAMKLMKGMLAWAWACPHVIEANCGATAIINEDPRAAGIILQRLGMKEYGILYRMERP